MPHLLQQPKNGINESERETEKERSRSSFGALYQADQLPVWLGF
jgi:hypothetical protein